MSDGIISWIEQVYPAAAGGTWITINRGGSDRQFWRGAGAAGGCVAVSYGTEKAENACYAACAEFLQSGGVRVPRVLAHDAERRYLLLEDVGAEDLWTHRGAPWSVRRGLYVQALEQVARLHAADLPAAESAKVVQLPFDAALYRWEQDYFFDHFLGKEHAANLRAAVPLDAQAAGLAERPRVLLHRDFQSQNIMVREGRVYLIDFQGMRAGLAGYDVASLLYDPYVPMTDDERRELSVHYAQTAGRAGSAAWEEELRACARQRLMQALGAYGFLGRVKGRRHFLEHIPVAAERLAALCDEGAWQPLAEAVRAAARHSP